jgi:hypothetical protein
MQLQSLSDSFRAGWLIHSGVLHTSSLFIFVVKFEGLEISVSTSHKGYKFNIKLQSLFRNSREFASLIWWEFSLKLRTMLTFSVIASFSLNPFKLKFVGSVEYQIL